MVEIKSTWVENEKAAERRRLLIERNLLSERKKAELAYGQPVSDDAYTALQATSDLAEIYRIACEHDIDFWKVKGLVLLHALSKPKYAQSYFVREMVAIRDLVAGRKI